METALGKPWTIKKQQQKPCRAQNQRMATWKSVGSIFTHTTPTLSPERLRGIAPHRERRAGAPSRGQSQPSLLRTPTVFTDAEPS